MPSNSPLQSTMFSETFNKEVFDLAQSSGYDYLDNVRDRNVFPSEEALYNLEQFEEELQGSPSTALEVIEKLSLYGAPATVAQVGGRYFGFVNGNSVPAGMAAKQLATFWDQNSGMQVISPLCSKLEVVIQKWLRELFGLPERTVAGFVSGTSAANFCGLAAARYRLLKRQGWDINEQGLFNAPKLRVVAGKHAHSTILKGIGLMGFGKENVEWVDVDDQGRIMADQVPELDDRTILILQAGNVNSGSFDPLEELCARAREANSWVHIDGAFGLWAGAVEKLQYLTKGMEMANSWAVDGHKTLNTPYDCGIALCEDEDALVSALHMTGSYIIIGDERDGMFYTPEMSRRSRIIELWATLRYLGKNGIDEMIFGFHERAKQFANEVSQIEGFQVLNDIVFNQVMVACDTDTLTDRVVARIQDLRDCWVGGASWNGRKIIRVSVCSWATTAEDISISVHSFARALKDCKNHD